MLALIGAKSNVFAASCVGVTYFVVLSAKFTLVVMLALMGAKSKVFAANCVGVTYFVVLSAKFTLVAILTLIGLMSNVFAANCDGVTYFVVLSAKLTLDVNPLLTSEMFAFKLNAELISMVFAFKAKLLFILVGSNVFAANWLGVTYILLLSTKFTLLFKAVLIASAVNDVILEAIISFTIFL